MKQVSLEGLLKNQRDVSRIIASPKIERFVALVSSFQLRTSFKKNPKIGVMGVLNAPLEF